MDEPKLFHVEPEKRSLNPMVLAHGPKEGRFCKDCIYLVYHETTRKYYKCKCRGLSHHSTTDHHKKWEACSLFREMLR
jgi:hypothetical protein